MRRFNFIQWIYVLVTVWMLGSFAFAGSRGWMFFGTGSQHATRGVAPVILMHK